MNLEHFLTMVRFWFLSKTPATTNHKYDITEKQKQSLCLLLLDSFNKQICQFCSLWLEIGAKYNNLQRDKMKPIRLILLPKKNIKVKKSKKAIFAYRFPLLVNIQWLLSIDYLFILKLCDQRKQKNSNNIYLDWPFIFVCLNFLLVFSFYCIWFLFTTQFH